jgi:hypothetical protein
MSSSTVSWIVAGALVGTGAVLWYNQYNQNKQNASQQQKSQSAQNVASQSTQVGIPTSQQTAVPSVNDQAQVAAGGSLNQTPMLKAAKEDIYEAYWPANATISGRQTAFQPPMLGANYTDVNMYYRYTPAGEDLPSLHQTEQILADTNMGDSDFDAMSMGMDADADFLRAAATDSELSQPLRPEAYTNVPALVSTSTADPSPVIPSMSMELMKPGVMDNFWDDQAAITGGIQLQPY